MEKWRGWIKQEIGGPPPAIEAATQAVLRAFSAHANQEQIAAEALKAAAPWKQSQRDIGHPEQSTSGSKVNVPGVVISSIIILVITYPLLRHGMNCAHGGCFLRYGLVLVDVLAVFILIFSLRR
jgi:hypothetical protein